MNKMYWNKQDYIKALSAVLSVREDFKSLDYVKDKKTGTEYLILSDIIGHVFMFNITDCKEYEIFHTVALIESGFKPNNLIVSKTKQMEIAKLFK